MEQKLQRKSSRNMAGSIIVRSVGELVGEVVIGVTEVVGDAARVVMNRMMAGYLDAEVHGGA